MLVLSRRVNEDIHINDDIVIRVVSIQGEKVKLGITAPRSQSVHRGEVYADIVADHQATEGGAA